MSRLRNRLPSLRALRAFEAVAELGSITRAAAELQVSVGAVSQQIRLLERRLGVALVERLGKGIALTEFGRSYHREVASAFDILLHAQASLEHSVKHTSLTVSALPSLVSTWLSPCLFEFRRAHAATELRVIGSEEEPTPSDPTDFRISYGHRVSAYVRFAELFVDAVVPVCAPALAAKVSLREPRDLLHLPLIRIEWDRDFTPAPSWEDWFRSVDVATDTLQPGLTFSLSSAAIAAAVAGHGFALAQLSMIGAELAAGRLLIPFDRPLPLREPYFIAWNATALKKAQGSRLLSWLIAAGRRNRTEQPCVLPEAVS